MNQLAPALTDLATGHTRRAPRTLPDQSILWGLALHDDTLAALTVGGTLAVWDTETLDLRAYTTVGAAQQATDIALTGAVVLVGYQDGTVRRYDSRDLQPLTPGAHADADLTGVPYDLPGAVRRLRIRGNTLLTAAGNTVTRTDAHTGESTGPALEHPARVLDCLISATSTVVTSCADNQLRIWDPTDARLLHTVPVPRAIHTILAATTGTIVVHDHGHLAGLGPVRANRV